MRRVKLVRTESQPIPPSCFLILLDRSAVRTYLRGFHQLVRVLVHLREKVGRHVFVPNEHVAFGKSFLHVDQLHVKNKHGAPGNLTGCRRKQHRDG